MRLLIHRNEPEDKMPLSKRITFQSLRQILLTGMLVSSLSLPSIALASTPETKMETSKPSQIPSSTIKKSQNWVSARKKTTARKLDATYNSVLQFQKSTRPLGTHIKSNISVNKIPGVTETRKTKALMGVPPLLLILTFLGASYALARSNAYER